MPDDRRIERCVRTSCVERQNRNAEIHKADKRLQQKAENDCHAIAIYSMYYNFARVHQTLRVTPAMESGLPNHGWSVEEICNLVALKKTVSNVRATEKTMALKALERVAVK